MPIDATTRSALTIYTNEQIAELCGMSSRLIGFASVDPHQRDAPAKLEHAVTTLGLRGLKLAPPMQRILRRTTAWSTPYTSAPEAAASRSCSTRA